MEVEKDSIIKRIGLVFLWFIISWIIIPFILLIIFGFSDQVVDNYIFNYDYHNCHWNTLSLYYLIFNLIIFSIIMILLYFIWERIYKIIAFINLKLLLFFGIIFILFELWYFGDNYNSVFFFINPFHFIINIIIFSIIIFSLYFIDEKTNTIKHFNTWYWFGYIFIFLIFFLGLHLLINPMDICECWCS